MGAGSGFGSGGGISGCGSDIWWRKGGVAYTSNEVHIDVVERIHGIVGPKSQLLSVSVTGELQVQSRLTGLAEVTLVLKNPETLSNAAFHPCVKIDKFVENQQLVFVPPDGEFILCTYCVNSPIVNNNDAAIGSDKAAALECDDSPDIHCLLGGPPPNGPSLSMQKNLMLPVTLQGVLHVNKYLSHSAKLELRIGCHSAIRGASGSAITDANTDGVDNSFGLENVVVWTPLPSYVSSISMMCSTGSTSLVSTTRGKMLMWSVGELTFEGGSQRLDGTLVFDPDTDNHSDVVVPSELRLTAHVGFVVKGWAASGIKIDSLDAAGLVYRACRGATLSGQVEFRL